MMAEAGVNAISGGGQHSQQWKLAKLRKRKKGKIPRKQEIAKVDKLAEAASD